MEPFKIKLDNKPHLSALLGEDKQKGKEIISTFVECMELAAEKGWHNLPKNIHSSVDFRTMIQAVLEGVLTTQDFPNDSYATLGNDVHPLSLLSDERTDLLSGEQSVYNWREHFVIKSDQVNKEVISEIIRKIMYLVRWFDIESVSESLLTNQFPILDAKNIEKLPFQPALRYQQQIKGDLFAGTFMKEVGLFDCSTVTADTENCPACSIGELETIKGHDHIVGCPRCNSGFVVEGGLDF